METEMSNAQRPTYPFAMAPNLVVDTKKTQTAYRPGESIDYTGIRVTINGNDVTRYCQFLPKPGAAWDRGKKKVDAKVRCPIQRDANGRPIYAMATFTLRRRKRILPLVITLIMLVLAGVGGFMAWQHFFNQPSGDTGSQIIPQGNMTDEEAQDLVNEMAEKSRITVSIAPNMALKDDGQLRVNFIVMEPNNGLSERLEVEQDGQVVYRSGIVQPGYSIEWGEAPSAKPGPATATVYAVSGDADTGNPISVEVNIVESN